MDHNSNNFVNCQDNNFTKFKSSIENWIAFDLEWEETDTKNTTISIHTSLDKIASGGSVPPVSSNKIVTFGFEDSCGNSGCYDITDFDSQKSFLITLKEKLLQYKYCFAWGSKAIERKDARSDKVEGINGDLVVLDFNFKDNGITSIIKYDRFTSVPYIKEDYQNYKQSFIADIDLLSVFAKPLVRNVFKNRYKSLRLDAVGKALLGYGKLENKTGAKLDEMSVNERKLYCLQDAHIVAKLARINNGQILKIMHIIASHTGLTFEEVCHKGMSSIWRKILNDAISKKISFIGYNVLPITLRKLYSNKTSFVDLHDNYYDYEQDQFENEDELSEYKENSYEYYIELLDQKIKERDSISTLDFNEKCFINRDSTLANKDNIKRKYKGDCSFASKRITL